MSRPKIVLRRIQLNCRAPLLERVCRHMRHHGIEEFTTALHDLVLGVGRFAPDIEDWLAVRQARSGRDREWVIGAALRAQMKEQPLSYGGAHLEETIAEVVSAAHGYVRGAKRSAHANRTPKLSKPRRAPAVHAR